MNRLISMVILALLLPGVIYSVPVVYGYGVTWDRDIVRNGVIHIWVGVDEVAGAVYIFYAPYYRPWETRVYLGRVYYDVLNIVGGGLIDRGFFDIPYRVFFTIYNGCLIGLDDYGLFSYNVSGGYYRWRIGLPDNATSPAGFGYEVEGDRLYIVIAPMMYAVDLESGEILWSLELESGGGYPGAFHIIVDPESDLILVTYYFAMRWYLIDAGLVVLSRDGHILWWLKDSYREMLDSDVLVGEPVLFRDYIIFPFRNHSLLIYNGWNGRLVARRMALSSGSYISRDYMILGGLDGYIVAMTKGRDRYIEILDIARGEVVWNKSLGRWTAILFKTVIDGKFIYIHGGNILRVNMVDLGAASESTIDSINVTNYIPYWILYSMEWRTILIYLVNRDYAYTLFYDRVIYARLVAISLPPPYQESKTFPKPYEPGHQTKAGYPPNNTYIITLLVTLAFLSTVLIYLLFRWRSKS